MNTRFLKSLIFNVVEIIVIVLMGMTVQVQMNEIAMLLLIFFITRLVAGQPLHYKAWYLCAMWSTSIFLSLFTLLQADLYVSLLAAVFTGYVTTGKGNINDVFLWGAESKYKNLDDFIRFNYDDVRLVKYETFLKGSDILKYNLFQLRFRQNKTLQEIKTSIGIEDQKKIYNELDAIYHALKYQLLLED